MCLQLWFQAGMSDCVLLGVGGSGLYIWQAWAWLWSGSVCDGVCLCVCLAKRLAVCVVSGREKWRGCVWLCVHMCVCIWQCVTVYILDICLCLILGR